MEILINDKPMIIAQNWTIQQLLDEIADGRQKGIAVAVNHMVIPRSLWNGHKLKANDNILVIRATQGG
jgi:sulfur carrier protein